ncbi:MAG: TauD/TfdA family dioxygenase [Alphaproteobacteria bacterium]|nr:TauD/TfdA family dioxygenase [Alphaproteobacteria bacterium]
MSMGLSTETASDHGNPGFQVLPLSGLMAAEVIGLDLSQPFDEATRDAVHQAFLRYQLLVFRGQKLTKPEQIAFTEQFGALERHTKFNRGMDDFPLLHVVSNLDDEGKPSGTVKSTLWHSDKSFRAEPSMATILHAVTMPPKGGDTMFANMYAAYEALPESEKAFLEGKKVVHSWELSRENIGRVLSEDEKRDAPPNSHPLARIHPETGRTSLFLGMHASHIDGMSFEDGRAKILELEAHATKPEFTFRHSWRMGDLLMWDNRCLLHRADPNFDAATYPRVLHRTCLRGTPTH